MCRYFRDTMLATGSFQIQLLSSLEIPNMAPVAKEQPYVTRGNNC